MRSRGRLSAGALDACQPPGLLPSTRAIHRSTDRSYSFSRSNYKVSVYTLLAAAVLLLLCCLTVPADAATRVQSIQVVDENNLRVQHKTHRYRTRQVRL